ncbi:conjugal transfer protein [uncultured Pseudokineococcus sp.]|uniref:conjugal transfer protein n=1 Tax=uncultured Pseudokineococcus sp. TaxID=1642928 RepID=UPI00262A1FED|nr:conjugal transfer protein [uncultured Pseudokineococcus sp.]
MSTFVLPPFDEVVDDRAPQPQPERDRRPARPWSKSSHRARRHRRAQAPVRAQARWTGGSALAARATTGLVGVALLAGPAALGLVAYSASRPAVSAAAEAGPQEGSPDALVAGQRAQQWVRAWLTTPSSQEEALGELWIGRVQLPAVASQVQETTVADLTQVASGQWSVTVAAVVTDPAPAGGAGEGEGAVPAAQPVTRFFQVPVAVERGDATVATVLALPAPVPAPASGTAPTVSYADTVGADAPVSQVVTSFLTAMLTGQGDLEPYLSPGTALVPVEPPAATSLAVRSVGPAIADQPVLEPEVPQDGARLRVLAQVDLVDANGGERASTYPLTLTARDGRWEITSLDALPLLRTPAPSATTAPANGPAPGSSPAGTPSAPATAGS